MRDEKNNRKAKGKHFESHMVSWGVHDFVGKFHLKHMTTTRPVPGTAIIVERERDATIQKRVRMLKQTLDDIETNRNQRILSRVREAVIASRVRIQSTIGNKIDAGANCRTSLL